eukprot:CAMPEP_0172633388 /NCGR_PEP_ID=MMETSP1068-20121228/189161_1 /TAXON_ID=35684 /ORGANISM="Pseudopedinella elastica, Strain CCMP716" /LENGTH=91 /DNA_ID=CAMNT_0013445069 /DNA_START=930 /DNA_END=1202 /DNA_ORIENTATION=+
MAERAVPSFHQAQQHPALPEPVVDFIRIPDRIDGPSAPRTEDVARHGRHRGVIPRARATFSSREAGHGSIRARNNCGTLRRSMRTVPASTH